jgi:hypothetical protein
METRIEVFKDDMWHRLQLSDRINVKYNAVINRVGKLSSREIGHTNTFSLPSVWRNRDILGLNTFNPEELAKSLNTKYIAKYYVEGRLLQVGFVVINNSDDGRININFIDEALEITELWGSTTFQEFLRDETLSFPADYQTVIDELKNYVLSKTSIVTPLSTVGTRGYNLALFPNNLNAIGDLWQLNVDEQRPDDSFNPYQSRPIFNIKAFLDLITESYGYTPIYDPSVDWDRVSKLWMVSSNLGKSDKEDGGIITRNPNPVAGNSSFLGVPNGIGSFTVHSMFVYDPSVSLRPNDVSNWVNPPFYPTGIGYWSERCIYIPNTSVANVGTITFRCNTSYPVITGIGNPIYGCWANATPGGDVLFKALTQTANTPSTFDIDISVNKSELDSPPAGAGAFIGVIYKLSGGPIASVSGTLTNLQVSETFLPEDVIAYDEQGQYLTEDVDMTHAASTQTIKKLLSGVMQQQGILMNIKNDPKEIKFFGYGAYAKQIVDGNFSDWSRYLLKYISSRHNTDYGNDYAIKNRIGLGTPYQGNTHDIILTNQGVDSKYKDFATNYNPIFKDISSVRKIEYTNNPHFEFTNLGLGMVESNGTLGTLSQVRADKSTQGNFTGLPTVQNVNYVELPKGLVDWYGLVDLAPRVEDTFLLPISVVKGFDLSEPVYIEDLGGFYIVEEIAEYSNEVTPVNVKLIKLTDQLRGIDGGSGPDLPISITLQSTAVPPNPPSLFVWQIANTYSFNNYTPVSATIEATQISGVGTGNTMNGVIDINANSFTFSFPIVLGDNAGLWSIVITDDQGLKSNVEVVLIGDSTPPPVDTIVLEQLIEFPLVNDRTAEFRGTLNFTPTNTTGVFSAQNVTVDFGTGVITPVGAPIAFNIPNLAQGFNVFSITTPATASTYWLCTLTADGVVSNDRPLAGGTLPFNII